MTKEKTIELYGIDLLVTYFDNGEDFYICGVKSVNDADILPVIGVESEDFILNKLLNGGLDE